MGRIQKWCAAARRRLSNRLPYHLRIGTQAEHIAERYLIKKKMTTIARNFSCRYGEVDLIMTENNTLVFVEVRLRIDNSARESVTLAKQRRIIKTAQWYLTQHPAYTAWPIRFDIVAMTACKLDAVDWLTNAFEAEY